MKRPRKVSTAVLAGLASLAGLAFFTAQPAHAEPLFTLRGMAGPGYAVGLRSNANSAGPLGALVAGDVLIRRAPGRALTLSAEAAGTLPMTAHADFWPPRPSVESSNHYAALVGLELHKRGSRSGPYIQAGIGAGAVNVDGPPSIAGTETGFALGLGMGQHWFLPSGPFGVVIGLRTSHVIARDIQAHSFALVLGMSVEPFESEIPAEDESH